MFCSCTCPNCGYHYIPPSVPLNLDWTQWQDITWYDDQGQPKTYPKYQTWFDDGTHIYRALLVDRLYRGEHKPYLWLYRTPISEITDTYEKAEKAMTEDESEPEKLTGDMFEAEGPDGTRHIFKASSFSAGTIIDPPGCNTFYHVHRPYNPDEPFCVWVDPLGNYYTNDDLAEIVRRCNAAHSPDTTMFMSHVSDIANN